MDVGHQKKILKPPCASNIWRYPTSRLFTIYYNGTLNLFGEFSQQFLCMVYSNENSTRQFDVRSFSSKSKQLFLPSFCIQSYSHSTVPSIFKHICHYASPGFRMKILGQFAKIISLTENIMFIINVLYETSLLRLEQDGFLLDMLKGFDHISKYYITWAYNLSSSIKGILRKGKEVLLWYFWT